MKGKKLFCVWLLLFALLLGACAESDRDRLPRASEPDRDMGITPEALASGEALTSREALTSGEAMASGEERVGWYENLPSYEGSPCISVNDGIPFFVTDDLSTDAFEEYSELDELGRCGAAFANVCREVMPKEERGNIGGIRPSGWHTVKYDIIADRYLYNRCHLIGYQLSGKNADERNLITGTRFMNIEGMLPWENKVAGYVEESGNHVLYRVTPYFEGENPVASGVLIEAFSVEDGGEGICFNVYCYNVQPGIIIDYATGESCLDETWTVAEEQPEQEYRYVLNKNTKKFHDPSCESVQDMSDKNKEYFAGSREEAMESGYSPCKRCNP